MAHKKSPLTAQEECTITKPARGRIKIALAYPNTYYVGMSNLGFQILYRILNSHPDVLCERIFLPDPPKSRSRYKTPQHVYSLESGTPLGSFHIIAFSLSYENDYPNILSMLSLADIPLLSSERPPNAPLIVGGGISAFLNPEPLADIFDLFIMGEAEEVVPEFLDTVAQSASPRSQRKPQLTAFTPIKGVYIPSAYTVTYTGDGLLAERASTGPTPKTVPGRKIADLDTFTATSCLLTPETEFANMLLIETSRGCPRNCRFCAVGSVYQPFRYRSTETLLSELKPFLDKKTKIGLLGAAVSDNPGLTGLVEAIVESGCHVSISSLRADALTDDLVRLLKSCNHKTFTIAPEAGSEKLRNAIGKHLSREQIFQAVRLLSRHKVPNIRLYFMIGLPGERDEDIQDIIRLTKEIRHAYYHEAKSEKWLHHIALSVSPFVPKPFTPFQWHPYEDVAELKRKLNMLSQGLKKEKKIVVNHDLPKWGYIQTLLSRGDRRTGKLLIQAHNNAGNWPKTLRETDINADFHVYRTKIRDEVLPWDFIDHGIDKMTLWKTYRQALDEAR